MLERKIKKFKKTNFDVLGLEPIITNEPDFMAKNMDTDEKKYAFSLDSRLYTSSSVIQQQKTDYTNAISQWSKVITY